jgi:hypothetical protein
MFIMMNAAHFLTRSGGLADTVLAEGAGLLEIADDSFDFRYIPFA